MTFSSVFYSQLACIAPILRRLSAKQTSLNPACAFFNPFTVGVAQGIAGVPIYSGLGYRVFAWVVATSVVIARGVPMALKIAAGPVEVWAAPPVALVAVTAY